MDIAVKVTAKSSKTELAGFLPHGTWKIKFAPAAGKGKANSGRRAAPETRI